MKKLILDFVWSVFPESLGVIIECLSGGWSLQKVYKPYKKSNELVTVGYCLICYTGKGVKRITLWKK